MLNEIPPIGFGCYRVDYRIPQHYDSLRKALISGIELIDTSSNYSDGGSEILAGKVIDDLIREGVITREEVTLVTKGGYIQGKNYKLAFEREKNEKAFPEVVKYGEGLWHCIHPEFLEDQITRQLERLSLKYIDVYLLHNPEYFLGWAKQNNADQEETRKECYRRIKTAFEYLEEKAKTGLIRYYGISSNTFPVQSKRSDFTSLERVLQIANEITSQNKFKFIQLPFNLIEAGAITNKNQEGNSKTVLEFAKENGIKVLINRPLNAITQKGLVRLADFKSIEIDEKEFIKQIKLVENLEYDIVTEKLDDIPQGDTIKKFLSIGKMINENWKLFGSIEHFNDTVEQYIYPRISFMMEQFEKSEDEGPKEIFNDYLNEVYKLLGFVSNFYKQRAEKRNDFFHRRINEMCDKKFHELTLSQKALLLLHSVSGVDSILVGARREKYIEDILPLLDSEKIPDAEKIIKKISSEIDRAAG